MYVCNIIVFGIIVVLFNVIRRLVGNKIGFCVKLVIFLILIIGIDLYISYILVSGCIL